MNLLAAAGAPGSSVRQVVVKSSTLVYGSAIENPVWFKEETPRALAAHPGRAVAARGRGLPARLRRGQPARGRHPAALLQRARHRHRHADQPGRSSCRWCRRIFGFDPLLQFVEEDDVVRSIEFVIGNQVPGIYNVAGDGRLPWSEVAAICGQRTFPLPPVFTGLAAAPLRRRLGSSTCRPSCSTCCATAGASTTAGSSGPASTTATPRPARSRTSPHASRLRRTVGERRPGYRYERDVEQFFRHSPAVVRDP